MVTEKLEYSIIDIKKREEIPYFNQSYDVEDQEFKFSIKKKTVNEADSKITTKTEFQWVKDLNKFFEGQELLDKLNEFEISLKNKQNIRILQDYCFEKLELLREFREILPKIQNNYQYSPKIKTIKKIKKKTPKTQIKVQSVTQQCMQTIESTEMNLRQTKNLNGPKKLKNINDFMDEMVRRLSQIHNSSHY